VVTIAEWSRSPQPGFISAISICWTKLVNGIATFFGSAVSNALRTLVQAKNGRLKLNALLHGRVEYTVEPENGMFQIRRPSDSGQTHLDGWAGGLAEK
jgi:hypothetical protein